MTRWLGRMIGHGGDVFVFTMLYRHKIRCAWTRKLGATCPEVARYGIVIGESDWRFGKGGAQPRVNRVLDCHREARFDGFGIFTSLVLLTSLLLNAEQQLEK